METVVRNSHSIAHIFNYMLVQQLGEGEVMLLSLLLLLLLLLFLLSLFFKKIFTGLSAKVLYFYEDYFLLITNIAFVLLLKYL